MQGYNFDQPNNRNTSHSWDMFHPLFLVNRTQKMLFLSAKYNNSSEPKIFFLKKHRLYCSCCIKCVCRTEYTALQQTEYSPVSPSLKSCSLKYMYSKLTDIYKEEHKEPEWTVTPERGGKKIKAARKLITFCKYCSTKLKFFSALTRRKVLLFIDSDLKYQ